MELITSTSNVKIKSLLKLSNKDNIFLITTLNAFEECIKYGYKINQIFIHEKYINKLPNNIKNHNNIFLIQDHIAKKLSQKNATCFIFATFFKDKLLNKITSNAKNIIMLDNVQNPENLGVIIRSALAFGVDYIICFNCVNKYHERLISSSTGLCLSNKIIYTNDFDYIYSLKNNYLFISTSLDTNSLSLDEVKSKYKNKPKIIVFGNEGHGVSQKILDLSKETLSIKMHNNVNSLNVSICVSIVLYELLKTNSH